MLQDFLLESAGEMYVRSITCIPLTGAIQTTKLGPHFDYQFDFFRVINPYLSSIASKATRFWNPFLNIRE
jgi:hypothetical protein